ncbi:helix-turn-helix domain-containing protein [Gemmiger formicilis]
MNLSDQEIGKKIKQFRKGKMTQQELATKIGKTESSIRKYEKGLVTIPLNVLEEIANALGIAAADLMGFEYFDLKNPNLANEIAALNGFESYLKSLGYNVGEPEPTEGNPEEGATAFSHCISGNGVCVTLSDTEYQRLQTSSGDLIFSFLLRKQQDQQKK